MNNQYLIVANWKMYFSYNQAHDWIKTHKNTLSTLLAKKKHTLVLCPSFDALASIEQQIKNYPFKLGAQDCSPFEHGAYTGQVQAQSLQELGCSYCIIGHSETRQHLNASHALIQKKIEQAIAHNLIPIIAIGEDLKVHQSKTTLEFLQQQLDPLIEVLNSLKTALPIYIAYEPLWAIGTGISARPEEINSVFQFIQEYLTKKPIPCPHLLLYGGSVNIGNIQAMKHIDSLAGFLIGSASTQIDQLKNIIELL